MQARTIHCIVLTTCTRSRSQALPLQYPGSEFKCSGHMGCCNNSFHGCAAHATNCSRVMHSVCQLLSADADRMGYGTLRRHACSCCSVLKLVNSPLPCAYAWGSITAKYELHSVVSIHVFHSYCVSSREQQRSWLYRIRPSVTHEPFHPLNFPAEQLTADFSLGVVTPNQVSLLVH
jgi:hypothetical protein